MDGSSSDGRRPLLPRLEPRSISPNAAPTDASRRVRSVFADLRFLENREPEGARAYADYAASYNPLGQFGARWSGAFSRPDDNE